jgi:hypothetical protein
MNHTPWKPGHFYSPFPSETDIARAITGKHSFRLPSLGFITSDNLEINLNQLLLESWNLLPQLLAMPGSLYPKESRQFAMADAILLFCVIAKHKPKRIIEVGSGHSSAMMIDVRDLLNLDFEITCIEPFPSRLRETLGNRIADVDLIELPVQDIENSFWEELCADCLIFIDSSHVSKAGSDVNYIFFDVFPRLSRGTLVHIHDIFRGFEYPEKWLKDGRAWNESYLLRAFLMFNSAFEIYAWPQVSQVPDKIKEISNFHGIEVSFPGSSLYLKKVE